MSACSSGASETAGAPAADKKAETPAERVLQAARTTPKGAFRLAGKSRVVVAEKGEPVESLDEESSVERTAKGTLHARYANSRDAGRELYVDEGNLWIRPLHGKYHQRPLATPDEDDHLLAQAWDTLAAQLELVVAWAKIEEKGEKVTLTLGGAPPRARAGWRGAAVVERLAGELTVTDGVVVRGTFSARLRFERDGRSFTMDLDSEHTVSSGPDAIPLPAAEESAPTHEVSTEWRERIELLSGIAPPPKKGGIK
jgi:hypothetical protein